MSKKGNKKPQQNNKIEKIALVTVLLRLISQLIELINKLIE